MFELFNIKAVLAFAPTLLPALRLIGLHDALTPPVDVRTFRRPSEDIALGLNPFRVWMEGRGIDLKTVARRMDEDEAFVAYVLLKDERADDVPHISASTIVKFCKAVDVQPYDLVPLGKPVRPDVIEAAVLYNRDIICGFDKVTGFLRGQASAAMHHAVGDEVSNAEMLRMCERLYVRSGAQRLRAEASVMSEYKCIQDTIFGAAKFVRQWAGGNGRGLPFPVYGSYRDNPETLPAFQNGEFGIGVRYADADKHQRHAACTAWMQALHKWYTKPETKAFLQTAANARYIRAQNYGIRLRGADAVPHVACP